MRFLVDAQLPPALARMLEASGHEAAHVQDVGLRDASDSAIWAHAMQTGAVLLTKDEDFANRLRQGALGPTVVWLRIGNTSRSELLRWFEALVPRIERLVLQGDRLVEVR